MQRQHARGVELGRHVGEHPLDRLVVGDRLAEGVARLGVGQRFVERGLADAERLRGNGDAAALERQPGQREALARRAEQLVGIDADVVEVEVHAAEAADAERIVARPPA